MEEPKELELPCDALEPLDSRLKDALREEAFRVNKRYLEEFLETHSICPFARGGRRRGQIHHYFYYADTRDVTPLLDLLVEIANDPAQVVAQVIMPLVEIGPVEWREFCLALTKAGNDRMGPTSVLACAALHPKLAYSPHNPNTLIPLFRRSPDPTIQWVRLDGLETIYAGRSDRTVFLTPDEIAAFMKHAPPKSLYDRIAESNMSMAKRLSYEHVESTLAGYEAEARQSYTRILLEGL